MKQALQVRTLVAIFSIVFLFATNAMAQSPGAVSTVREISNAGNVYTQKIAVLNTDTTVILSQASDQSHYDFYLVDENAVVVSHAEIPSNYVVLDFKILEDTIYFCGQVANEELVQGFVARAGTSDLFFNANFDWDVIQTTLVIDKIEVYHNPDNLRIQIVGIGRDMDGTSLFVHCDESASWNYDIYKSYNQTEIFDDICLRQCPGFYPHLFDVFIAGRSDNNERMVVRKIFMNNFTTSFNAYYDLYAGYQATLPYPIVLDSFSYRTIAIAGIINAASGVERTNVFTIDISAPVVALTFYLRQIQSYGSYNKGEAVIRDLMFDTVGTNDRLIVLEDAQTSINPNVLSSLYVLVPHTATVTTYNADVFYSSISGTNYPFNSLTRFAPYDFVVAGINPKTQKVATWRGDRSSLNGNCNLLINEQVNVDNSPSSFENIEPLDNIYTGTINWQFEQPANDTNSINTICN
ncbi:MAG: hypothetical protein LBO06_05385 [Bacteroidales bacterium]|jgi:hypothetical protein|nr:hypothetical protein [Bacteroidales bacterium]